MFSHTRLLPLVLSIVALTFCSSVLTGADFRRGDVNADETLDMSDAVFLLGCQFNGGECPTCDDAADANDDGAIDISDASYLLAYLFQNGPDIPEPSWCGPDPTIDRLTCVAYAPCEDLVWSSPAVPEADMLSVWNEQTGEGRRLVWRDGYNINGDVYFAVIFEKTEPVAWASFSNMNGTQLADEIDSRTDAGYRVLQVDSYVKGSNIRYAVIFVKESGPDQLVYHSYTGAQHQAQFDFLKGNGWQPVNVSPVNAGAGRRYTALWEEKVGSFWLKSGLTPAQYQTEFEEQTEAGRELAYLHGYNDNGQARLSALWKPLPYSSWAARHGLNWFQYVEQTISWVDQGYKLMFITGYQNGSGADYAAFWAK